MPWDIHQNTEGKHCVYKVGEEEPLKCYDNQADAENYGKALYANAHKRSQAEYEFLLATDIERMLAEFEIVAATNVERGLFADLINGLLKFLHLKKEDKPIKERWILGDGGASKTHCEKCIAFAEMGWQPLGFFPKQRAETTFCGPDCTCHFEYEDGNSYDNIERIAHWEEWEAWSGVTRAQPTFFIHRQIDNNYRWFAWPACTAFINRDQEIDSRALFDNFIRHIEEGAPWPFLTFFHQGEKFKMGEADFVARDGVAYCLSGLFDENKLAQEAIKGLTQDNERFWGTSINYEPLGKPYYIRHNKRKIPVYYDGIHKEVSLLPEKAASSLFTAFPITKE